MDVPVLLQARFCMQFKSSGGKMASQAPLIVGSMESLIAA